MTRSLLLAVSLVCALAAESRPQTAPVNVSKPAAVRLDSALVSKPAGSSLRLMQCFQENAARPFSSYLARNAWRAYGLETYEMSRLQCAVAGADMGLTLGLIAGAAGMMSGALDEKQGWYVAGAAAALGALFGGAVKADDPSFRIRLRWDDSDRESRRR